MSSGAGVTWDGTDRAGRAAAPESRHAHEHDHHGHDHHAHDHHQSHREPGAHDPGEGALRFQPQQPGFSLMRTSLGERLLLAAGLSALLWVAIAGVLWS